MGNQLSLRDRIILVPQNSKCFYVYWEVSESAKEALRRRGGEKLVLKLYDVTEGIDLERQPPQSVQQFDADELTQDRPLSISLSDRDCIAELGYVTGAGRWLKLFCSETVHVPSQFNFFPKG